MKKVILTLLALAVMTSGAYASDLGADANTITGTALSNNVLGSYFSDTANFVISTVHTKGNKAYATGNQTTAIWRVGLGDPPNDASALIQSVSTYDDTAFAGFSKI